MNKKTAVFLGVVFVALMTPVIILLTATKEPRLQISDLAMVEDRSKVNISIGSCKMTVEVVNLSDSIITGLSNREKIGSDGMLFVFKEKSKRAFWMLDMRFDLDIVFFLDDKVINIEARASYPDEDIKKEDLPTYQSKGNANLVLEIDAGRAERCSIGPGDAIRLL
jgi:uncharacterized membrane protein (UPF0127 family)